MFVVHCAATTVKVTSGSMPLLAELVSGREGFCYKHGAPSGALLPKPAAHSTENSEESRGRLPPSWLQGPVFPVFRGGEVLEGFELAGEVELVHDGLGHLLHDTCSERLKAKR